MMENLTTDTRGRLSLGIKDQGYRVTELGGGTLLLEPTHTLTHAEYELLRNERLHADVLASMSHVEAATPRARRGARA